MPRPATTRVLVVDDNVDACESQFAILTLAGHDVRMAREGREAVAIARDFQPSVVLLDIALPGEDGYSVARRLRADPATRRTCIVALTGFGRKEDVERSREAGFDEHLTQPVEPDRILRIVASHVRS